MPRFAFELEYDGSGFVGWQSQANGVSVQDTIQSAIHIIEPEAPNCVSAGRTDSGVHALGQIVHCDLAKDWEPSKLCDALNSLIRPQKVSILQTAKVNDDFSARFSAIRRSYMYRIVVRRSPLVHHANMIWRLSRPLDHLAMQKAANYLIGRHDFTTFRSVHCQSKSPVKTLDMLTIEPIPFPHGIELRIRAQARSFLHRQVRSIVGTLERVGAGAWTPRVVQEALQSCDRSRCGPVAPAHGLFLERVDYEINPFT